MVMKNNSSSRAGRTALYCRVVSLSSHGAGEIDTQLSKLREFAEKQGFSDFVEYSDIWI